MNKKETFLSNIEQCTGSIIAEPSELGLLKEAHTEFTEIFGSYTVEVLKGFEVNGT